MSDFFNVIEHVIDASHIRDYARATAESQEAVLQLHVKQYTPKDDNTFSHGQDVTIIGGHANGIPKEMYEPLWDDLYQELKKKGIRVRHIWIADVAWQGQSGILNHDRRLLGNDPSWYDHARDMMHMINVFRMPRPLVAFGHSFGANALSHAALLHPRLFHSMVLLDPVITPNHGDHPSDIGKEPAAATAVRRETWPSRQRAAESFRKHPFYRTWDPRALNRWIRFGLRQVTADPDGEVALATTKAQETFTFLRPSWPAFDDQGRHVVDPAWMRDVGTSTRVDYPMYPLYRPESMLTYMRLPSLRPSVLYVSGAQSPIVSEEHMRTRTEITGTGTGGSGGVPSGRVKETRHAKFGHMIPFEDPAFCARQAAAFLETELELWKREEEEYREWANMPFEEKTRLSPTWMKHLGIKDKVTPKI